MQQPEIRALRRAVALLVAVSVVRWSWSLRSEPLRSGGEDVLPELLEASRKATVEGARRSEPLAGGERIDPNRAPEVELDRLPGVGPVTARAIAAAREEGLVFRRPEDLLAVRGIGETTLERLRPALDLAAPPAARPGSTLATGRSETPSRGSRRRASHVDVNRADLETLQSLPGIGPALAERIVEARQVQEFTSIEDLTRVRGIGRATVDRIRPLVSVGRAP